jgi:hypothetical protein
MRYLSIYKAVESNEPPSPELFEKVDALIRKMTAEGTLITTDGWLPSASGVRVRNGGGAFKVTDGPFTESKELIAGFALLEARDKAHVVELAKEFLGIMGDGECEIRPLASANAGCGHPASETAA